LAGLHPAPAFLNVRAALELFDPDLIAARRTYERLVALSDGQLLRTLFETKGDRGLVEAADHHCIPLDDLTAFLGVNRSTVYRRIAAAR
jgi:hypothetical protein